MASSQFSDQDRKLIINQIERQERSTLRRVGRYRKLLRTRSGDFYCIVGGTGNWHGISESMIERIEAEANRAYLVVVVKQTNRYEVYLEDFQPLIDNLPELSYTKKGNYQFHIDRRGRQVCLREIDGYCMELNSEISANGVPIRNNTKHKKTESSERVASIEEILEAFDNLSAKDQRLLLAKLTKRIK